MEYVEVPLSRDELEALEKIAEQELRSVPSQARYLLRRALGIGTVSIPFIAPGGSTKIDLGGSIKNAHG